MLISTYTYDNNGRVIEEYRDGKFSNPGPFGYLGRITKNTVPKCAVSIAQTNIAISTLYPNPTSGILNLSINLSKADELNISIINNLGIEMQTINSPSQLQHTQQLDLSHLPKGVYHMLIRTDDEVVRKAFVLR